MDILVTGGAGYIGSVTCNLLAQKHYVVAFDNLSSGDPKRLFSSVGLVVGDLRDKVALASVISNVRPDVVVHLAAYAWTKGAPSPMVYWENVEMTKNLLEVM